MIKIFKSFLGVAHLDRLLAYVLSKRQQLFASLHALISQKAETFVIISNTGPNLVQFSFLTYLLYEHIHPDLTSVSICPS